MRYAPSSFLALWILAVLGCAGTRAETVAVAETCAGVPSVEEPVEGKMPQYPMRAAQRRIEGWVDLKLTLGPEGRVENLEICGLSDTEFRRSALRAVRTWRYEPLAVPEPSQITLRVRFADDGSVRKQKPYFLSPQELVVAPEHRRVLTLTVFPAPAPETCSGTASVREPIAGRYPEYPMRAAQREIEGWIDLALTLLPNGDVERVDICDSSARSSFEWAALSAVRRWRYEPLADSEPNPVTLRICFVHGPPSESDPYFVSPQELVVTPAIGSKFFGRSAVEPSVVPRARDRCVDPDEEGSPSAP